MEAESFVAEEGGGSHAQNHESDEEEQFDMTLAASHSYMGPLLVALSGRSVLEAGWEGRVPVIAHHGAVFPGETVPMLLLNPHDAHTLMRVIKDDKLFGLLCPDESGSFLSGYGVLCEVFEAVPPGESALPLTFKARAISRFRFVDMPQQSVPMFAYNKMRLAAVRVLPELRRGDPLRPARLASLDPLRDERRGARLRRLDAAVTAWPQFVYDIFDYRRMRQLIEDYFKTMALTRVPDEPLSLSYWTASNLPLSARDRLALFVVDDVLLRLHMEVRFITRKDVLRCACSADIARREDIFPMSTEGVHANFTNLGGYVHDVVTVERVTNTRATGVPTDEFTWFPGYTWTLLLCTACSEHVGWRFDAMKRSLRPQRFYCVCRNSVQPRAEEDAGEEGAPPEPPRLSRARALAADLRAARQALSALRYRPA